MTGTRSAGQGLRLLYETKNMTDHVTEPWNRTLRHTKAFPRFTPCIRIICKRFSKQDFVQISLFMKESKDDKTK